MKLLGEAGFLVKTAFNRDIVNKPNADELYNGEGMRGLKELHGVQGTLIEAEKI